MLATNTSYRTSGSAAQSKSELAEGATAFPVTSYLSAQKSPEDYSQSDILSANVFLHLAPDHRMPPENQSVTRAREYTFPVVQLINRWAAKLP